VRFIIAHVVGEARNSHRLQLPLKSHNGDISH